MNKDGLGITEMMVLLGLTQFLVILQGMVVMIITVLTVEALPVGGHTPTEIGMIMRVVVLIVHHTPIDIRRHQIMI